MCVCVRAHTHAHMNSDACRGQKVSNPLELELQVLVNHLMWVGGAELGFPERGISFLNPGSSFQPQNVFIYLFVFETKPNYVALTGLEHPARPELLGAGIKVSHHIQLKCFNLISTKGWTLNFNFSTWLTKFLKF